MKSSPIKVIFFDAVGTLFEVKGSVGEVYLHYAKSYGVASTEETLKAVQTAFRQAMRDMPPPIFSVDRPEILKQCERLWWFDVVHAVFYRVGMFEGFDEFFDEVFEAFGQPTHWEVFPDTHEVLTDLKKQGFELGIISNFDTRFFHLSRALGLNSFFDSITISSLAGAVKPDKKIFLHALDNHVLLPQNALHVGDDPVEDFEGASRAGLHAVLIDRSPNTRHDKQTLTSLSELYAFDLLCL